MRRHDEHRLPGDDLAAVAALVPVAGGSMSRKRRKQFVDNICVRTRKRRRRVHRQRQRKSKRQRRGRRLSTFARAGNCRVKKQLGVGDDRFFGLKARAPL